MTIDRVADFDDGYANNIYVRHFIDTDTDVNFIVSITCSYPKSEFEKVYEYEEVLDSRKLKITLGKKPSAEIYTDREEFYDERHGWLKEPEHAEKWDDIESDKLLSYVLYHGGKEMIKDIFNG
jgi:hypothetical protein